MASVNCGVVWGWHAGLVGGLFSSVAGIRRKTDLVVARRSGNDVSLPRFESGVLRADRWLPPGSATVRVKIADLLRH